MENYVTLNEEEMNKAIRLAKIIRIVRFILIAMLIALIVMANRKVVVTTYSYGTLRDKVTKTCTYVTEETSLFGRKLNRMDGRIKLKEVDNFEKLKKNGTMTVKDTCWRG